MKFADFLGALMLKAMPHFGPKMPSDARIRMMARLSRKRTANKGIPSGEYYSRQQDRATMRMISKQQRSIRKAAAMRDGTFGGSAVIS